MARTQIIFALAGGLSIALACGGGGDSFIRGYSSSGVSAGDAAEYSALDQAYLVAPDRAVLRVDIVAADPDAAAAGALLRSRVDGVVQAAGAACSARVLDYRPPTSGGGDTWQGSAEVRVDIPRAGLGDVTARMDALDACYAALTGVLTSSDGVEVSKGRTWVTRSASPVLLVDDPQQHAAALLARHAERLAGVADASGAAQLHPEDLRCTATGAVDYGGRRLSGVQLVLGMDCRVVIAAPGETPQG